MDFQTNSIIEAKDAEIARLTESVRLLQARVGGLHGEVARRDAATHVISEAHIREIAATAALAVARNAQVAEQLCFPHIYLTLKDMLPLPATAVSHLHAAVQDAVFDGYAVYKALTPHEESFVSYQAVSTVLDALARVIRAAPAAPAQPDLSARVGEWLPIETAPKDGTCILLGREEDEANDRGAISTPGRWHEEDHDGPDNMGHDAGFMDDEFQQFAWGRSFGNSAYKNGGFQPTKWMPLPAAPTLKAK